MELAAAFTTKFINRRLIQRPDTPQLISPQPLCNHRHYNDKQGKRQKSKQASLDSLIFGLFLFILSLVVSNLCLDVRFVSHVLFWHGFWASLPVRGSMTRRVGVSLFHSCNVFHEKGGITPAL